MLIRTVIVIQPTRLMLRFCTHVHLIHPLYLNQWPSPFHIIPMNASSRRIQPPITITLWKIWISSTEILEYKILFEHDPPIEPRAFIHHDLIKHTRQWKERDWQKFSETTQRSVLAVKVEGWATNLMAMGEFLRVWTAWICFDEELF